mgnify:CR=1 FL=1
MSPRFAFLWLELGRNELLVTASTIDGLANIDLISFSEGVSNTECDLVTVLSEGAKTNFNKIT